MPTSLPLDDRELHEAFEVILSIESFSDYIIDIAGLVCVDRLSRDTIQKVLDKHQIADVSDIKVELMDLLIVYANLILNDHIISEKEKFNIEILKKYFRIKEGDFYSHRYQEIEDILHRQFERIYLDNRISLEEALHQVELQGLFDLSYDQFDQFKEQEIRRATRV